MARVPTLLRVFYSCATGVYESFMRVIVLEEVFGADLASNNEDWQRSAGKQDYFCLVVFGNGPIKTG